MPVKIRLQRHGKKGKPFYWVVAADSRAKRDGKYLEKLGTYNPNTNPATINLDIDGSVKWLQNGAQPTDTARNILSYKGVMLKHHLLGGLRKGALTEEQVEEKFNAWLEEKVGKIADKVSGLDKQKEKERAEVLKAEKAINEKRIAEATEADAPEDGDATADASAEPTPDAGSESTAEPKADTAAEPAEAKEEPAAKEDAAEAKKSDDKAEAKNEEAPKDADKKAEEAPKTEAKAEKASDKPDDSKKADVKEDKKEEAKATKKVVETPEVPEPDRKNAEDNFAAPVKEKKEIKKDDSAKEAPSVQEVVTDEDFEKKDADKPKPAEDKE